MTKYATVERRKVANWRLREKMDDIEKRVKALEKFGDIQKRLENYLADVIRQVVREEMFF